MNGYDIRGEYKWPSELAYQSVLLLPREAAGPSVLWVLYGIGLHLDVISLNF